MCVCVCVCVCVCKRRDSLLDRGTCLVPSVCVCVCVCVCERERERERERELNHKIYPLTSRVDIPRLQISEWIPYSPPRIRSGYTTNDIPVT